MEKVEVKKEVNLINIGKSCKVERAIELECDRCLTEFLNYSGGCKVSCPNCGWVCGDCGG